MKRSRIVPKKDRVHIGEDGIYYRVKPWVKGVVHGFVIEMRPQDDEGEEGDWTVLALFYQKETDAIATMLTF